MSLVTGSGPGIQLYPDPNRIFFSHPVPEPTRRILPGPGSGSGRVPGTRPVCRTRSRNITIDFDDISAKKTNLPTYDTKLSFTDGNMSPLHRYDLSSKNSGVLLSLIKISCQTGFHFLN